MNQEIKDIMAGNLKVSIGSFPVSRRNDFLNFLLGEKDKTQDKKKGKVYAWDEDTTSWDERE